MFLLNRPSPRAQAFDVLVADAAQIVEQLDPAGFHEEVRPIVERMGSAVGALFLPNIVHGVAEVPRSMRETDGLGVVPILNPDEEIGYGASFLLSTPSRKRLVEERTGVSASVQDGMHKRFQAQRPVRHHRIKDAGGGVTIYEQVVLQQSDTEPEDGEGGVHLFGRPLILTQPDAPKLLHEIVHGEHDQTLLYDATPTYVDLWRAVVESELRAYHVGSGIRRQTGRLPRRDIRLTSFGDFTEKVEETRKLYSYGSAPFGLNPRLVRALSNIGLVKESVRDELLSSRRSV